MPSKSNQVILLLLACLWLFAFAGAARGARLPVTIYTSADGLGSGFVDSMFRDSRGFMWFCTRDGLSRFDGARFVNYQIGDRNAPPGIESLYETRDGVYWISTTGGTYRFDPARISPDDAAAPRLNAEYVTAARGLFFEDRAGNLWITSGYPARLVRRDDGGVTAERFELRLPPRPNRTLTVSDITETADGSLWFDTSWGLVRLLSDGRTVYYPNEVPVGTGNTSLIADRTGRLWLSRVDKILVLKPETPDELPAGAGLLVKDLAPTSTIELTPGATYRLPGKSGEIYQFDNEDLNRFVENSYAKRIYQTSDGNVWITSENHLLQFRDGVFELHSSANGLPNVMARMAEDAAGNLWIGGHAGLARLDRQGLSSFGASDGANSSRFFTVAEDPQGALYFAGRNFYLSRLTGTKFETARPGVRPAANYLWTSRFAFCDARGDWWILTGEGLYRFSGARSLAELAGRPPARIYTTADGLKSNSIFQIFEDSRGDVWVSTRGGADGTGTARMKRGETRFQVYGENEGLPPRRAFSSAVEDAAGRLWFTFYEGGLARFDGAGFEFFGEQHGLPPGMLSDLHLDREGRLWIGSTLGGLLRIDDPAAPAPVFARLTTAEGLHSNNIRTITEDRFGRIYAGTARGVDRLTPDTLHVKHYSVSDGLAADFVVDSRRDRDGNLWFVTNDGVSRLVPLPEESASAPRVLIGGLQIAGEQQPVSRLGAAEIATGELAAGRNNLQIDFFGLDFRAGETLRYQHKLEGADANWSRPTETRTRSFANLAPGDYRFLVRAINSEGLSSEQPAVVSFRILPPVYARWWFVLLAAFFVTAVITLLYRYRTARLLEINAALAEAKKAEEELSRARAERLAELERVRTRIATDLHDDIGSSLTQIAVLSEVAQAQGRGGGATESLKKITNVSNDLVGAMSDIVWSINPSKDHLSDLTQRMRRFAADTLTAKGIGVHFRTGAADGEMTVSSNLRREVFLIFKEAVNNIVRHSGARRVEIEVRGENDRLRLRIKDDGRGLPVEAINDQESAFIPQPSSFIPANSGGNGLANMRRRAGELGGRLELESAPGEGTTVTLRLPLGQHFD